MLPGEGQDRSQKHYLLYLNLWSPAFFLKEAEGQAKIYLHSPLSHSLLKSRSFTSGSK